MSVNASPTDFVYRDSTRTTEDRVDDLIGRMTLEEKVAQLTGILPFDLLGPGGLAEGRLQAHLGKGLGQISAGGLLSSDPSQLVAVLNQIQQFLVERTRLGIPAIVHHEALAGLVHQACYDFPTAITLAASWDPEAVQEMNAIVRRQMRALGIHQACSPVLDIARDARWGRVQETYGEDPYLSSAIGVAFVRGLQGDDRRTGVLATAKHFLGYAMADGGRNLCAVQLGERELLEVYARPFGAAISEAGLESVMCAYSDVNGEPAASSRLLLTDTLRGSLQFEGMAVADYGAVNALYTRQKTAVDPGDAGVQALRAGLDVELPGSMCYQAGVAQAVRDGDLDEAVVDRSVRRVLSAKFRLGLFESPYGDAGAFAATLAGETRRAAQKIGRRIATRSTVLLANPLGILPLSRELRRIAVIGPNARSIRNLFGGYSAAMSIEMLASGDMRLPAPVLGGEADDAVKTRSQADDGPVSDEPTDTGQEFGFVRRIATRPTQVALEAVDAVYARTPTILSAIQAVVSDATEVLFSQGCDINDPSEDGIPEAVNATTGSDVAILVLGDKTGLACDAVVGETRDRSTVELAGAQRALLDAVIRTEVPVVVVLIGSQPQPVLAGPGGPAAVLHAYQPGSVGGLAVANVLFGLENPSGRVPISIPRTAGQCPIFHGHKSGSDASTYTDLEDSGPAYCFGHGLSYTTFDYRSIHTASMEVDVEGSADVQVEVANTGERFGEEVVQLYASIRRHGVTRPVRELVGFHRVSLQPGASATVCFTFRPPILAYLNTEMRLVVSPGPVRLMAGPSSAILPLCTELTISGVSTEQTSRTAHLTPSQVSYT